MRRLLIQLLHDRHGMILSSEVVLVGTILVLGSIVGLAALSHAVNHELNDVANAYDAFNGFSGLPGQTSDSLNTSGTGNRYWLTDSRAVPEVAGY